MISNADDEGRIRADAGALRRLVFGFDDDITRENVDSFIVELRRISSLHFYEIDDERHAHFTNWTKFQKLQSDRIAPSLLPPCPDCSASIKTVQDCIVDEDGSKTSIPIRIRIAQRDKMCMYCGIKFPTKSVRFVLEHMVPVSQGGKTTDDNCVLACWSCNTKKGGRTPEQAGMELIQDGSILDPNVSVGKVSIGKSRLEQNSVGKESAERKTNYPSQSSGSVADAQEKPRGVPEIAKLRDAISKKNPPKLGILLLLFSLLLLAKPTYAADKIVVRYKIKLTNGHNFKLSAHTVAGGAGGSSGASTSPSPTRTASQQPKPSPRPLEMGGGGRALAGSVKDQVLSAGAKRFGEQHTASLEALVMHESGFNQYAGNKSSGACGLFQAMPCEKMGCSLDDVQCQIDWGFGYIERRYGNPTNAWDFWQSRRPINGRDVGNWY